MVMVIKVGGPIGVRSILQLDEPYKHLGITERVIICIKLVIVVRRLQITGNTELYIFTLKCCKSQNKLIYLQYER
jgi:hypothetical protein